MIAILHQLNYLVGLTAHNLFVMVFCAVTLCVVVPFFLVIATIDAMGSGAAELVSRWHRRRGRRYDARGSYRETTRKRSELQ